MQMREKARYWIETNASMLALISVLAFMLFLLGGWAVAGVMIFNYHYPLIGYSIGAVWLLGVMLAIKLSWD